MKSLFASRRDEAPLAEVATAWHDVGGRKMHSRYAASEPEYASPQVVLVHGQVVSSRYMTPLIERLGVYFPVAAPDLPGFGRSDKPSHVLTIRELADALAEWQEAAGIGRAVLLGNSLGCQIAVECALRHPERVRGLVLQGPTPDPAGRSAPQKIMRALSNSWQEQSVGLAPFLDYLQAGLRRAWQTGNYLLQDPIEEKLPAVQVPTLVVRGARDPVAPQRWVEEATRLLPRGELRVVPGAAHTMVAVAALELTRVVRPFLLRLEAQQRQLEAA
jgi:2-hydroxy-6-oxonona-2,4-dienedioate hydrolase